MTLHTNTLAETTTGLIDSATHAVGEARAQTGAALTDLAADARHVAQRGVAAVREGGHQLREHTAHMADSTVGYIKEEPLKSALIAAAVGAALMALVTLASRSFGGPRH